MTCAHSKSGSGAITPLLAHHAYGSYKQPDFTNFPSETVSVVCLKIYPTEKWNCHLMQFFS